VDSARASAIAVEVVPILCCTPMTATRRPASPLRRNAPASRSVAVPTAGSDGVEAGVPDAGVVDAGATDAGCAGTATSTAGDRTEGATTGSVAYSPVAGAFGMGVTAAWTGTRATGASEASA
jgi:hypothetical protein